MRIIVLSVLFSLICLQSFADIPVCTAPDNQYLDERLVHKNVVPDGNNGVIVAWYDYRLGTNSDIYAQKFDSLGNHVWTLNGVQLNTTTGRETDPVIVTDGSGGAIVVWQDSSPTTVWDIKTQRIDASGNILWGDTGVFMCKTNGVQEFVAVVEDGSGGAICAWQDARSGNWDIYVQKIDANGNILWTTNGVAITNIAGNQWSVEITTDGSGGAIITWYDNNNDIYAQRVASNGSVMWTANGVPLCTEAHNQKHPTITSDSVGGAIVVWEDARAGLSDIYAQRIRANGNIVWANNGIGVCTYTSSQNSPMVVSDGCNGAIIIWPDFREWNIDIYSQRIDSSGNALWQVDGIAVIEDTSHQYHRMISEDGFGGALICWEDDRNGSDDIFVQHIDENGNLLWTTNGVHVCCATTDERRPSVCHNGRGGAFLVWEDRRNMATTLRDLYGNYVDSSGSLGVEETQEQISRNYNIMLISPNPFKANVQINYTIHNSGQVNISIYNILGERINILVDEYKTDGNYIVIWNGRDDFDNIVLPGVYYCKLNVGNKYSQTQKILFIQ